MAQLWQMQATPRLWAGRRLSRTGSKVHCIHQQAACAIPLVFSISIAHWFACWHSGHRVASTAQAIRLILCAPVRQFHMSVCARCGQKSGQPPSAHWLPFAGQMRSKNRALWPQSRWQCRAKQCREWRVPAGRFGSGNPPPAAATPASASASPARTPSPMRRPRRQSIRRRRAFPVSNG